MVLRKDKKYHPRISAGNKTITFKGIFSPQNVTGMAIGGCKRIRFYIDDHQYYEGEMMKIAEKEGTEDFKIIGGLVFKRVSRLKRTIKWILKKIHYGAKT